jgi:hypothetical protein
MALLAPVTYTLNSSVGNEDVLFVLVGASTGSFPFGGRVDSFGSGTLGYSVNGGPTQFLNYTFDARITINAITPADVVLDNTSSANAVPNGTVVLSSGTFTTNDNFSPAAPANRNYTTFIVDGAGDRISSNGVSNLVTAPEPASAALALPLALGLMTVSRRRKVA